jgi:hypothetical protein
MDTMVSAIIHLANKDYSSLVDDFISLEILPADCDRAKVVPLMDKALTPYVKGGGAQKYKEELESIYGMDGTMRGTAGGFQAMTQDAITVLNDIPFSIPPYFALLGRAIVTLEGIALTGDENYGIIMEAYPFVARKLLNSDRPAIQKALQEVLYTGSQEGGLSATRLSVLLNSALGVVARSSGAFVDLDSIPKDAVGLRDSLKFLLSDKAVSLRKLLEEEAIQAGDILMRQGIRKSFTLIAARISSLRPPFFGRFLPTFESTPALFLLPPTPTSNAVTPLFVTPTAFIEASSPKLSREEELYALSLKDLALQTLGRDVATLVNGDALLEPLALVRSILSILSNASILPNNAAITGVARSILRRLSSRIPAGGEGRTLDGVISDVGSLTSEEMNTLVNSITNVTRSLAEKLRARLQPLASSR